ncbi:MAG TPA: hypothetical protein VJZ00_25445 [Thermoanaerobaculia bacterium]|nr:hypothetical protein [Thermoanaerobaculia bacterium]
MRLRSALVSLVLVFVCASAQAIEPIAVQAMNDGSVAVLSRYHGLWKYDGPRSTQLVKDFGTLEPSELTTDGNTYFIALVGSLRAGDPNARVERWGDNGRRIGSWPIGGYGTAPTGLTFDVANQIVYCADGRSGDVFRLDLRSARPAFARLFRIPNVGAVGPLVVDAARKRLIVADVQKGRILSVPIDKPVVEVLVDTGTVAAPSAMTLDGNGRLFVTDSAKARVWMGDVRSPKVTLRLFAQNSTFKEPVGVAVARDGTTWIADRGARMLRQFASDGRELRKMDISR